MSQQASLSSTLPQRTRFEQIDTLLFWLLLTAITALIVVAGPVLTSDGPAHVAIAHAIAVASDPSWPVVKRLYDISPILTPNAVGHYLLAGMMLIMSPLAAEKVIRILCIAGIPLAGRLALRQVNPSATWLALFLFPVALQATFLMGLYNYTLSIAGCLLSIWAYLRLRVGLSPAAILRLGLILVLTIACQVSGWLESFVAIAALVGVEALLRLWRRERLVELARVPAAVALAVLPSLALFAWFTRQTQGAPTHYVVSLYDRFVAILTGASFASIGRATTAASFALTALLGAVAVTGLITWRRQPAYNKPIEPLHLGLLLLPLAFLAYLLVIPDEAGGGWTHVWRAEPFPYIGVIFACAVLPVETWLRNVAVAVTAAGACVWVGMIAKVQVLDVPPVLREFNEVDALIPAHCTIAPVLSHFKLDPLNRAQLAYHPMFHAANRLQFRDDRPVLFSYVARLPVYPARFRPNADPQRFLFGWLPFQRDTRVYTIDMQGFEAASGLPVDYVLLWDVPIAPNTGAYDTLRVAMDRSGYQMVYRSSGGRMEVYRRPGSEVCSAR